MRSKMGERLEVKRIANHRQTLVLRDGMSLPARFRPSIARVKLDIFGHAYMGTDVTAGATLSAQWPAAAGGIT